MDQDEEYEARRAKVRDQCAALLAKAASTEFEAERETFEAAAAAKMKRWMLDEAELRGDLGRTRRGAGDIFEQTMDVAWLDGLGVERGQLMGAVGRAFGVETVINGTNAPWTMQKFVNLNVCMFGTRAALDAVAALIPGMLLQCEGAGEKAWQTKLDARRRTHEDRRMRPPERFDPYAQAGYGYGDQNAGLIDRYMAMQEEERLRNTPGLCKCGCGEPADPFDPFDPYRRGPYNPNRYQDYRFVGQNDPDPYRLRGGYGYPAREHNSPFDDYGRPRDPSYIQPDWGRPSYGDSGYREMWESITGEKFPGPAEPIKLKPAMERLAEERITFLRSFYTGWAARAGDRLARASTAPEPDADAGAQERAALVLKADADRAQEELKKKYPDATGGAAAQHDAAAYAAGMDAASGADLGGERFSGGYGGRRELGA